MPEDTGAMQDAEHQTEALGETVPGAPHPGSSLGDGEVLLDRFKLIRLVGRGGMGEVYEARDLRLHGRVALKTVRASSPESPALLERLRREVQLARVVTHPNVCRVFDFHEGIVPGGGAVSFVTMEFLDGVTLSERLHRDGPFAPRDALPLLRQMAEGLAAIHARGLVHRDVKPGNVMLVPDGPGLRAVVTDLGIAHAVGPEARGTDWGGTDAGAVVGSPAYMAPEQRAGSEVTARTDVHALAQVAREMVGGAPRGWRSALRRALDPDPARRPPDPRRLVEMLGAGGRIRRLRTTAASAVLVLLAAGTGVLVARHTGMHVPADRRSIAVLPLISLGAEAGDVYFADGLTEDISTQLTKLKGLQVTAQSATRALRHTHRPTRDIAEELGVGTVLEGTVRRAGDRVRISARLVDARTDRQLWAETYDRDVRDVLDVQADVASKVAGALALQLSAADGERLRRGATTSPEAYDLYLRGLAKADDFWRPEVMRAANRDFEAALAIDPGYALAHAQLALLLVREGLHIDAADPALLARGRAEAERALALEPELAVPHIALGTLLFTEPGGWDVDGAMREFRRAEALEPGSAQIDIASLAFHVGLEDLALDALAAARRLNPSSRAARGLVVATLTYNGHWAEALQRAKDLDVQGEPFTHAEALLRVGRIDEAMRWVHAPDAQGNFLPAAPVPLAALILAVAGKRDQAAFLAGFFERGYPLEPGNAVHHSMHAMACLEAQFGHPQRAIEWLRKAARAGLPNDLLFERDPLLEPIRSEPEFVRLMAELGAQRQRRMQEYR